MTRPPEFTSRPTSVQQVGTRVVHGLRDRRGHRDDRTISPSALNGEKFNAFDAAEIEHAGNEYFDRATGPSGPEVLALDLGCGSGRWTRYLSSRVGPWTRRSQRGRGACGPGAWRPGSRCAGSRPVWTTCPVPDGAYDLAICLGVLHHVPDTAGRLRSWRRRCVPAGICSCTRTTPSIYRGPLYRAVFRASDLVRAVISRLPGGLKRLVVTRSPSRYTPPLRTLARLLRDLKVKGWERCRWPSIMTRASPSCGTMHWTGSGPPEQRFTREEMAAMMRPAGLSEVRFSEHPHTGMPSAGGESSYFRGRACPASCSSPATDPAVLLASGSASSSTSTTWNATASSVS